MASRETFVQREQHRIYVRDHPGAEPAIILMHGFPDNVHLYDRLSPYLSPPRRVVLFDFLGWGSSDKPSGYPYTTDNQVGDLDAVITQLGLGQVVLVAHDASAHRVTAAPAAAETHPLHCLVCHWARSFRPRIEVRFLTAPAAQAGVVVHVEYFTAAARARAAQPPLRSPPSSPDLA